MLHVLAAICHIQGSEQNNNPYIGIYKKRKKTCRVNRKLTAASTLIKKNGLRINVPACKITRPIVVHVRVFARRDRVVQRSANSVYYNSHVRDVCVVREVKTLEKWGRYTVFGGA